MANKRRTSEEIVTKLRNVGVHVGQGMVRKTRPNSRRTSYHLRPRECLAVLAVWSDPV
jgi:hypothetical protein